MVGKAPYRSKHEHCGVLLYAPDARIQVSQGGREGRIIFAWLQARFFEPTDAAMHVSFCCSLASAVAYLPATLVA
jgi:hypothetical protein